MQIIKILLAIYKIRLIFLYDNFISYLKYYRRYYNLNNQFVFLLALIIILTSSIIQINYVYIDIINSLIHDLNVTRFILEREIRNIKAMGEELDFDELRFNELNDKIKELEERIKTLEIEKDNKSAFTGLVTRIKNLVGLK